MTVKKEPIYEGKIIQVNRETVCLPTGYELEFEIVHHPGGVVILAEDVEGKLCLIRQFRHAVGSWIWEFPAGKLEPDESPAVTAGRELLEEVGIEASNWQRLGETVTSPGILTEIVHVFYARELHYRTTAHEAGELIEIHWLYPEKIRNMAREGLLNDAKSLVGLYLLSLREL